MEVAEFKNTLLYNLRKISDKMNKIITIISEKYGVTVLQLNILFELYHNGKHTVGSLAASICVAEANLSVMCKKLENRGLLKRVRRNDDGRVVEVTLTQMGEEVVCEIDEDLNKLFRDSINDYDLDSHEKIIRGVEKLHNLLAKIAEGK